MKLLICIILIAFVSNIKVNKKNNHDIVKTVEASKEMVSNLESIWNKLFKTSIRKCSVAKQLVNERTSIDKKEIEAIKSNQPIPRKDYYGLIELGFGKSAYYFDFIDELLLSVFIKGAKDIVDSLKRFPLITNNYEDPYTLNKMLAIPLNTLVEEEMLRRMVQLKPDFDSTIWKSSVNAVQLHLAIKEYKWAVKPGSVDPAKELIDKFDFNGDGRLSSYELIAATIYANKSVFGESRCSKCFEELIEDYLDPIYAFIDCENSGKLTSENMYKGLKFLKRPTTKYNIFLCESDGLFHRTDAINDFVLKSRKTFNGEITKKEFIIGNLIGFWSRQVERGSILEHNEKNGKEGRWNDPNSVDNKCPKQ